MTGLTARRRSAAGLIAARVLLAGLITWTSHLSAAQPDGPAPPLVPYAVTIRPGLHLLGALEPSAAYAVETGEGIVLIDSGLEGDAGLLKAQMARLNLDWKRIQAVLITHAHWDHAGGAEHIRAATGAKVYAGIGDAGVLRAGGPREALYSAFPLPAAARFHPTTIDVELKGGERIKLGDVTFLALATPGHTPGSICYLMERDGRRVLFGGDVISMLEGDEKSPARIWRPLGTYSTYLPPRFRGDARSYLASLRMLRTLPAPDLVLPGHPRGDPTPQTPQLPPERWEAILDRGIAEMRTLAARYETDGADFLDGEPKQLVPDLFYLGDFHDAAVYGFIASSKLFLVDAPGGPGLLPFVQSRLLKLGRKPDRPAAVLLTSCDPPSMAGLADLVRTCHPAVVAPSTELDHVMKACPPGTVLLPAEKLADQAWFEVSFLPIRGTGLASAAYRLRWAGKVVLFSGRIPLALKDHGEAELDREVAESRADALDYLASIHRLSAPRPDLWLPRFPVDGRNANLYDDDWQAILNINYRAGNRGLKRAGGEPAPNE